MGRQYWNKIDYISFELLYSKWRNKKFLPTVFEAIRQIRAEILTRPSNLGNELRFNQTWG